MSASDVCTPVSIYVYTHQCKPLHLPTDVYIYTITYRVYPYISYTVQMSAHVCTPCTKVTSKAGKMGGRRFAVQCSIFETFTHSLTLFTHSLNFVFCSFERFKIEFNTGDFSCVRSLQSVLKPNVVRRKILTSSHGWKMGSLFFPAHGLP